MTISQLALVTCLVYPSRATRPLISEHWDPASMRSGDVPIPIPKCDSKISEKHSTGWWLSPTPLKNDGVRQLLRWLSHILWKIKNVWNHQPVNKNGDVFLVNIFKFQFNRIQCRAIMLHVTIRFRWIVVEQSFPVQKGQVYWWNPVSWRKMDRLVMWHVSG